MLIIPESQSRQRRIKVATPKTRSPVLPLTLVSASYAPGDAVTLAFDRAIDIDSLDASAIVVRDGQYAFAQFVGGEGATLDGASTVVVPLAMGEGWSDPGVRLSVGANSGIVAADGGTWAGVSDVELPFG